MRRRSTIRRAAPSKRDGFALLISLVALTILAVLVADLHETTGTSFAAAVAERDQLRAEYMAKSGINLTRMLIAQERTLRMQVTPIYRMMVQRPAPQLPVWQFANSILRPFADFDNSKEDAASAGFDLDMSEGLGKTNATFEIMATAENGKINVNDPRLQNRMASASNVAGLLYSLIEGGPSPNKYDVLFSQFDEKGRLNSRLDLVGNVVDWWDFDDQRTTYDPAMRTVQTSGAEDAEYYRAQTEPYSIKNAPFDTLEELRLVRGMSDDVWATFVEPDLEDPNFRQITVWGGPNSSINPNEAEPIVLLARVCTFPEFSTQQLCNDMIERTKFIALISMVRAFKLPIFSRRRDFVNFLTGKQDDRLGQMVAQLGNSLGSLLGGGMPSMGGAAGGSSSWPFVPLVFPPNARPELRQELERTFTTTSRFFTIESTGRSGRSQRRIRVVINIDDKWSPPKPNAGKMPPLGVFAYYRIE